MTSRCLPNSTGYVNEDSFVAARLVRWGDSFSRRGDASYLDAARLRDGARGRPYALDAATRRRGDAITSTRRDYSAGRGGDVPLRGLSLLGRRHPHTESQAAARSRSLFPIDGAEPCFKRQPLRLPVRLFPDAMDPFERCILPLLPGHRSHLLWRHDLDQRVTEPQVDRVYGAPGPHVDQVPEVLPSLFPERDVGETPVRVAPSVPDSRVGVNDIG